MFACFALNEYFHSIMEQLNLQNVEQIKEKLSSFSNPVEARGFLLKMLQMDKFAEKRKIVEVGSLPVHCEVYESKKDDPVNIFIPGIGTYAEMYCEFLYKLSQWGFNVIGIDLRGHGYSGGDRGYYTTEEVQSDISEIITHFSHKYNDNIALFGCSIGSPLALAAAENDNRVKALLCHTLFLTEYPLDLTTMVGWKTLGLTNVFMPHYKIDFRMFIDVNQLSKDSPFKHFMDFDDLLVWNYPVKTLNSVYSRRCKVLWQQFDFKAAIILGDKDELVKVAYEKDIISKMQHPFELVVIPEGKHMLPFDHIKDLVLSSRDFFNKAFQRD